MPKIRAVRGSSIRKSASLRESGHPRAGASGIMTKA
jgi:hypothetical protein